MAEPQDPSGKPPDAFSAASPMPVPPSTDAVAARPPAPAMPTAATAAPSGSAANVKAPHHHDSFREFLETIVFVVVLVLILKTFLAEAFVIPTGSMATTLLGAHKEVTCEKCGYPFLVNASNEAEHDQQVTGATCPNCFYPNDFGVRMPRGGRP
jgi:hypothetical protein